MKLTDERKQYIDNLGYTQLLERWRFAPVGDPWFTTETGHYWSVRMKELRDNGADHVGASKTLGWKS